MWLTTAMVIIIVYNVFSRYVLQNSITALSELAWHFYALIFLLGAAYTLKHDGHVRVDLLYHRFNNRQKAWVNLLGTLFFLIPVSVTIIWYLVMSPSFERSFVVQSWRIGEISNEPGGLPARYLIKTAIPIGFLFLILQGIAEMSRNILFLRKPTDPTE